MKTVIAGLEEGLNAIADALEGGGGDSIVPTPTLDDDGKVLTVISQSQEEVAPEWTSIREVPIGGRNGQVLTKNSDGYGWANASGGGLPASTSSDFGRVLTVDNHGDPGWATPEKELPSIDSEDSGKVLQAWYDSEEDYGYTSWGKVATVPSSSASDNGKVLTCAGKNAYGWAPASGGGHMDVIKFDVAKSSFTQDGQVYKAHFSSEDSDIYTKINNVICLTIVDNVDEGYPTVINPVNDECSIWYEDEVYISISSTIYGKLGNRGVNHFYMTYYTGQ